MSAASQRFAPTVAAAPVSGGEESLEGVPRNMGQVVSPQLYMSGENLLPLFTWFDEAVVFWSSSGT